MNISCIPRGIVDTGRTAQGLSDLTKAGFERVVADVSLFCSSDELVSAGRKSRRREKRIYLSEEPERTREVLGNFLCHIKETWKEPPSVAIAPYLSADSRRQDLNGILLALAKETIKLAGATGCSYVVVYPLHTGMEPGKEWECNRVFYLELAETAKETGLVLLPVNRCKSHNGHLMRGFCADPEEARGLVEELNRLTGEERFGFCLDIGTVTLCGQNQREVICSMGDVLKAVIFRDCDGVHDDALLPFTAYAKSSTTDWLGVLRGLREICFDGELLLNFLDTARSFSPLLKPDLLLFAKKVSDYLKWQIEMEKNLRKYRKRVLFGAGNMCRNYMKDYGESYPPLFTCDNNRALWGSIFCGLEVKSPESLIELPHDCSILICNIWYREIESQLREMGVKNPIEYFNDEYMQTFYMDRLDMAWE